MRLLTWLVVMFIWVTVGAWVALADSVIVRQDGSIDLFGGYKPERALSKVKYTPVEFEYKKKELSPRKAHIEVGYINKKGEYVRGGW